MGFFDAIILFAEETPLKLISTIKPDILAKGGDYKIDTIVGHDIVKENVENNVLRKSFSPTTERLRNYLFSLGLFRKKRNAKKWWSKNDPAYKIQKSVLDNYFSKEEPNRGRAQWRDY